MNTLCSAGGHSRGSQSLSAESLTQTSKRKGPELMVYLQSPLLMTGGEGPKEQRLCLSPSGLLSLSHREEEPGEAVKAVMSTHTEASDEVWLPWRRSQL